MKREDMYGKRGRNARKEKKYDEEEEKGGEL